MCSNQQPADSGDRALSVYMDFWGNEFSKAPSAYLQYQQNLLNAILEDYRTDGSCSLVSKMLQSRQPMMSALECSVVETLLMCQDGQALSGKSPRIPLMRQWQPMEKKPLSQFGSAPSFLKALDESFQQEAAVFPPAISGAAPQKGNASAGQGQFEAQKRLEEEAAELLKQKAELQKLQEEILQEKNSIGSLRSEAQHIREEALEESLRILEEARAKAEALLASVPQGAQEEQDEQGEQKGQDEQDGQEENPQQALLDAQNAVAKLEQKYLAGLFARQLDQETADSAEEVQQSAWEYQRIQADKQEMDERAGALKGEIFKAVTDAGEQLQQMLRAWQSSLYPHEYGKLADCYTQLYRILANDRCLQDELLAQLGGEASPKTIEDLKKLRRSLLAFRKNLELAMARLGLQVYVPEPGEPFDSVLHSLSSGCGVSAEDAEEDNMVVAACEVPGVERMPDQGGRSSDPLIRAVVTVWDA